MGQNYSVFVHLLGQDGQLLAQSDTWPADAHRPTSVLSPGDTIRDVHYLDAAGAIPQDAVLRIGLYESITNDRLLLSSGQDALMIDLVP
jgi:hypothetical protein